MMRCFFLFIFMFISGGFLFADTFGNPGQKLLEPGSMSVFYEEEYLEYRVFYGGSDYYTQEISGLGEDMFRGIIFRAGARYGITEEITAGAGMIYIFQKLKEYQHNDFHFLLAGCSWEIIRHLEAFFELKIPFQNEITDDVRLISNNEMLAVSVSLSSEYKIDFFRLGISAGIEQPLKKSELLRGYLVTGAAGFDIYSGENRQKIELNMEAVYMLDDTQFYYSNVLTAAPQVHMRFWGGFNILIGAEFLLYADNTYRNKTFFGRDTYTGGDMTYFLRLNYDFDIPKNEKQGRVREDEQESGGYF
ncbi:MAG: hypothetical protein ACLFP1_02860 [Candidatus Goldiibacteriota bacterium]